MATQFIADEHEIRSEWHAPELGHFSGHDAMVPFFASMLSGWNAFLQGLMSGVVVIDRANPDRATGRWFVQETGQRAEGTNVSIAGVYHDEYRREAGLWLIKHRR